MEFVGARSEKWLTERRVAGRELCHPKARRPHDSSLSTLVPETRGLTEPRTDGMFCSLVSADTVARIMAEQEVENLSGLSTNPEKDIFVVRENGTTCLMAEFAAKFIVPYDVWASNYVDVRSRFPLSLLPGFRGRRAPSLKTL